MSFLNNKQYSLMIINIVYNEMAAEKCYKNVKWDEGMQRCYGGGGDIRCALDIGNLEKPSSRGNN